MNTILRRIVEVARLRIRPYQILFQIIKWVKISPTLPITVNLSKKKGIVARFQIFQESIVIIADNNELRIVY